MRVLVTGADGFLGSHLVSGLTRAGHEVVGAVYARPARPGEVRVDLTRSAELVALPHPVDAVVNAAGVVDPKAGAGAMFAVNLMGVRNLVGWARERGVHHLVHFSSVAVYGPFTVGEDRDEKTLRWGALLGLPYMKSKARAERAIERGGVPYTLLRPPAVVGSGDTVISRGFVEALAGEGIPLLPGARPERRVSLAFAEGLVDLTVLALARGPLGGAVHAIDAELTLGELCEVYASVLQRKCTFTALPWSQAFARRADAGFSWLVASARFGQHYRREKLVRELGYAPRMPLKTAVQRGVSGLQGGASGLF